ncbi:Uncharacterised protein [Escherichia coli]|uniref:Uncharacterized protein n=1 Tax=Escherichia coli TaxID=562 RepID=A0A2X3JW82_ECOLX|nr:Uncharacterised protein [Escherichia coli]
MMPMIKSRMAREAAYAPLLLLTGLRPPLLPLLNRLISGRHDRKPYYAGEAAIMAINSTTEYCCATGKTRLRNH